MASKSGLYTLDYDKLGLRGYSMLNRELFAMFAPNGFCIFDNESIGVHSNNTKNHVALTGYDLYIDMALRTWDFTREQLWEARLDRVYPHQILRRWDHPPTISDRLEMNYIGIKNIAEQYNYVPMSDFPAWRTAPTA